MLIAPPISAWQHVLVTGASSGIGLSAVQHLLGHSPACTVWAVARQARACPTLQALSSTHAGRLRVVDVDLTRSEDIEGLAASVLDAAMPLDLVFHAAGRLHGEGLQPEKSLRDLDPQAMAYSFALNAVAPVLLLRALLPGLRRAPRSRFASLSARVGSISDNRLGGWYSYRAAKAAQNQLLKTAAIELRRSAPGLCVALLHPGTVDTPLSRPFQRGVQPGKLFSPEEASRRLLDIVARLEPEDSGRFIAWDGQDVPW